MIKSAHTHTHTHIHIYIYIYLSRLNKRWPLRKHNFPFNLGRKQYYAINNIGGSELYTTFWK
jgi:hypothetical protein